MTLETSTAFITMNAIGHGCEKVSLAIIVVIVSNTITYEFVQ